MEEKVSIVIPAYADDAYDVLGIPNILNLVKNADLVVGKRIFSQKGTHPFKASLQLTVVFIFSLLLSILIRSLFGLDILFQLLFFIILSFLSLLSLMCHIYIKGMKIS